MGPAEGVKGSKGFEGPAGGVKGGTGWEAPAGGIKGVVRGWTGGGGAVRWRRGFYRGVWGLIVIVWVCGRR